MPITGTEAGEFCELHEGRAVEAGHAEPVGVAGPAATALGVEHQRDAPLFGKRQHAVDLLLWFMWPCVPASTV